MEILCDILLSLIHCVCGVYCLHADSFSDAIYICECFVVVIIVMNILIIIMSESLSISSLPLLIL